MSRIYIEARPLDDINPVIQVEVGEVTEFDALAEARAMIPTIKNKLIPVKYYKHLCYHNENQPCELIGIEAPAEILL